MVGAARITRSPELGAGPYLLEVQKSYSSPDRRSNSTLYSGRRFCARRLAVVVRPFFVSTVRADPVGLNFTTEEETVAAVIFCRTANTLSQSESGGKHSLIPVHPEPNSRAGDRCFAWAGCIRSKRSNTRIVSRVRDPPAPITVEVVAELKQVICVKR